MSKHSLCHFDGLKRRLIGEIGTPRHSSIATATAEFLGRGGVTFVTNTATIIFTEAGFLHDVQHLEGHP